MRAVSVLPILTGGVRELRIVRHVLYWQILDAVADLLLLTAKVFMA